MDNRVNCDYVFIAGKKKGQVCDTFCRGGGPKCSRHKPKKLCEHNARKDRCRECGGGSVCEHNRLRTSCKECGGGSICEHSRQRSHCRECGGGSICEHSRIRSICKECGGGSVCEHSRSRLQCKDCGGGSICEHGCARNFCKPCGGGSICKHNKRRDNCDICDPHAYIKHIVSCCVRNALGSSKSKKSLEYIGCDAAFLRSHLENQFKDGMTWENQGEWHIDHIVPIMYNNPSLEEVIERLHYTNLQPMWAADNIAKGNRFVG